LEFEIGPHVGVSTKKGKIRTIEMPANLMRDLNDYGISERREIRLAGVGAFGKKPAPLFINQRRVPYTTKSIMKLWGDIRTQIRMKFKLPFKHDFHDLRASYGTYRLQSLIDAGVPPSIALTLLMGWMGHDQERDTWRYLSFLKAHEVRKHAMTMLDDLMDEVVADVE
jgi:hypothetical protein